MSKYNNKLDYLIFGSPRSAGRPLGNEMTGEFAFAARLQSRLQSRRNTMLANHPVPSAITTVASP